MNQLLNYKVSKYSLNILNINLEDKIIIRVSDNNFTNIIIRNIINQEKYFIKILKTDIYNGNIHPFRSNNLLIEYIKNNKRSLKSLFNKLSINEVDDIQLHLFAIILDLFEKYNFVHGNLSENNIFIKYHKNKRKYYIGSIPLEDNFDLFIDETNNSICLEKDFIGREKYNLVSDVIKIRKICFSLLENIEQAYKKYEDYKSVFEDYEIHIANKIIKSEFNRIYTITMKLLGFLRFT